jgi:hypothetical protein
MQEDSHQNMHLIILIALSTYGDHKEIIIKKRKPKLEQKGNNYKTEYPVVMVYL